MKAAQIQSEEPLSIEYVACSFRLNLQEASLLLFTGAEGTLRADSFSFRICGTALVYLSPGCDAAYHASDAVGRCLKIGCDISRLLPRMLPEEVRLFESGAVPVLLPVDRETEAVFLAAWQLARGGKKERRLDYLLIALLVSPPEVSPGENVRFFNAHQEQLIEKVKNIVGQNLSGKLSLESIAGELFVNASYLSSLFRRKSGFTFCQYVSDCRVTEAKRLLAETSELVDDIAAATGFGTTSYFITVFRKRCGVTPNVFRRRIRQTRTSYQFNADR